MIRCSWLCSVPDTSDPLSGTEHQSPMRPTSILMLATLTLGVTLISQAQVETISDAAHHQFVFAYRLLQRGQDKDAAAAFDEYLGDFPNDEKRGDAVYYRALLAMRAGQPARARQFFADAPEPAMVPRYALHLLRGQLSVEVGRYEGALTWLERIDATALDPTVAASVLHLRGVAYRGAGNLPAAAAQFDAAGRLKTSIRPRVMIEHARVLSLMDRPEQAMTLLRRCLAVPDPATCAEAAKLGGDLALGIGRNVEAAQFYRIILESHQTSKHFVPAVQGAMWAAHTAGRFDDVRILFEQYIGSLLEPEDRIEATYLAATARQELGGHAQVVGLLQGLRQEAAQSVILDKVLYRLARSQSALADFDGMRQTLDELNTSCPESPLCDEGGLLAAAADIKRGRLREASARFTGIIDKGSGSKAYREALRQRSHLYATEGHVGQAIADGEAWIAAFGTVRHATADEMRLRLIDLYHRAGDYEASRSTAEALLVAEAGKEGGLAPRIEQEAMYRHALALIKLKRFEASLGVLDRLELRHPMNPYQDEAGYYRGLVLIALGRSERALPHLFAASRSARLGDRHRVQALRLAAVYLRRQDRGDEAEKALIDLKAMVGLENLQLDERTWLARRFVGQGKHAQVLTILEPLLEDPDKLTLVDRSELLFIAGGARRATGSLSTAVDAFEEVMALGGRKQIPARLELARTYQASGQHDKALDAFDGLINQRPTAIAVQALLGRAAVQRQLGLRSRREDDLEEAVTYLGQARRDLERVILLHSHPQLSPWPQLAHVELHRIHRELGKAVVSEQRLRANLGELKESFPDGPYAEYAEAMLAIQHHDPGRAVRDLDTLRQQAIDEHLRQHVQREIRRLKEGR